MDAAPSFTGVIRNVDLTERKDINHVNIDEDPVLQGEVIADVMKILSEDGKPGKDQEVDTSGQGRAAGEIDGASGRSGGSHRSGNRLRNGLRLPDASRRRRGADAGEGDIDRGEGEHLRP